MAIYEHQIDLGTLSAELHAVPSDTLVHTESGYGLENFHSYRGYYEQAAIEPGADEITAGELAELVDDLIGTTLEGWKGGDFYMKADTEVWVAMEGCTGGDMIMGTEMVDGVLIVRGKPDVW